MTERSQPLVLSLFPGIGLLDMAFEEEGFCVVRGPDPIWGGDIRTFFPPAGKFDGVIGGPPCQIFSELAKLVVFKGYTTTFGNLIAEYERVAGIACPAWFVMENVTGAPAPNVPGYFVAEQLFNNRWTGAEQERVRRISFGTRAQRLSLSLTYALLDETSGVSHGKGKPTVTSSDGGSSVRMGRYTVEQACALQGIPAERSELLIKHLPFRNDAKLKAVANGVPLPMGRAIAKAVKRAMYPELASGAA